MPSETLATTVSARSNPRTRPCSRCAIAPRSRIGGIRLWGTAYVWLALVGLGVGLFLFLKYPDTISRVLRAAGRGRAAALQTRLHNLVTAIERFAGQPWTVWLAFAGAIAVQALLVLFYVCAARSLSVPLPLLAASVIVPVSLAVQMAPVSINGFGVREAVFAFFFSSLGFDVSSALTLSLGSAALIMLFLLERRRSVMLRSVVDAWCCDTRRIS